MGHGYVEFATLGGSGAPPALRVEVDGQDGLSAVSTSALAPGAYAVRFGPDEGVCEPLVVDVGVGVRVREAERDVVGVRERDHQEGARCE